MEAIEEARKPETRARRIERATRMIRLTHRTRADDDVRSSGTGIARRQTVGRHFHGSAASVVDTYSAILEVARTFGVVKEEPKKTSIHLVRTSAFAGVAVQKTALVLTLKSDCDVPSKRIRRHERASANRWHVEVRLETPADVDSEIRGWLERAYSLAGPKVIAQKAVLPNKLRHTGRR